MSITIVKKLAELDPGFILAPERYDPRRETLSATDSDAILLDEIVDVIAKTASSKKDVGNFLVLDTSNANEGVIATRKEIVPESGLGSTKKKVQSGDVIISRLRPYLRQVAFVDNSIPRHNGDVQLVCSTEFFVLRSKNAESIAFLVPYLLSNKVQSVLAASQEGGHHPRFNADSLVSLPVPKVILNNRKNSSKLVETSISKYRNCEAKLELLVHEANQAFEH